MSDMLILGYYNTRGLAETIRTLLSHLEVEYEDRLYDPSLSIENPESWEYSKFNLGFDFPNLPYIIDNNFKLTQSKAILQYICRKYRPEYLGNSIQEQATVNMLGDLCHDLNLDVSAPTFNPEWHSLKHSVLEKASQTLNLLNSFLENKQFLLGDCITWPDFYLYEILSKIEALQSSSLTYNNLSSFMQRFKNLPHIFDFETRRSRKFFSSSSYSGI